MKKKISLTAAVLICTNTIVGAGLFLNPKALTITAGQYGFLGYIFSAALIFPLILSMAELSTFLPVSGGLYVYSKTYLNRPLGFLSGWSYFIGKTVSAVFILHAFTAFIQKHTPALANIPTLFLDYGVIAILILLNIGGLSLGGRAQYFFNFLKAVPVVITFILSFFYFEPNFFSSTLPTGSSLVQLIPITLYAYAGFEVICSVGSFVENPTVNIKKAIIIAFTSVVFIYGIFSLCLYSVLGPELMQSHESLLALGLKVMPGQSLFGKLLNAIVFTSIIGGSFSMITTNCWNMHTLASNGHFPFAKFLTKVSESHHVPWVSLCIEGFIAALIITITQSQIPLQNMTVFAMYLSHLLTSCAAYQATKREHQSTLSSWIPKLAILSCTGVIALCLKNIITFGVSVSFLSIFFIGCTISFFKTKATQ